MDIALTSSELECLQRAACIMITGAMRTTPSEVLEMFLDLPTLRAAVVCSTDGSIPPAKTKSENLRMEHNRIWVKADKTDNKFSMLKDHVTLRCTFGRYRNVIPTREKW